MLAKLPGDVLLAGLMAVYTKNGIFASLFILHSVSAAPKPWYYALYVPGSGWGVFSTWDLCAAHGAIGGSRARHKKYRSIQEALDHINVHYPIPTSTQILLDFWYPFEGEATPAHPGVLLQPVVLSPGTVTTYAQPGNGNGAAASSSAASSSTATGNGATASSSAASPSTSPGDGASIEELDPSTSSPIDRSPRRKRRFEPPLDCQAASAPPSLPPVPPSSPPPPPPPPPPSPPPSPPGPPPPAPPPPPPPPGGDAFPANLFAPTYFGVVPPRQNKSLARSSTLAHHSLTLLPRATPPRPVAMRGRPSEVRAVPRTHPRAVHRIRTGSHSIAVRRRSDRSN